MSKRAPRRRHPTASAGGHFAPLADNSPRVAKENDTGDNGNTARKGTARKPEMTAERPVHTHTSKFVKLIDPVRAHIQGLHLTKDELLSSCS